MKCLINGGVNVPEYHVIFERGRLHKDPQRLDKIPISTKALPKRRFQTFPYISLLEKLISKSRRSQNKTFIREASPVITMITYEL